MVARAWRCLKCGHRTPDGGHCPADGWVLVRPGTPSLGEIIDDRYALLEKLGEGGMGTVYRALDGPSGILVALKLLRPAQQPHVRARERFEREARLLARVKHPNVATFQGFGEAETSEGRLLYLVQEYVAGENLVDVFQRSSPSVERGLGIAIQLLQGLDALHAAGVIHRDLKPGNVLVEVGADGLDRVKLIDLGLATALTEPGQALIEPRLTAPGMMLGTFAYMAPEQFRGEPAGVGVDLYAAALVIYWTLAGRTPFEVPRLRADADQTELVQYCLAWMKAHLESPVPSMGPRVPAPVQAVLRRALEKEPEQRFASVVEMTDALSDAARQAGLAIPHPHDDEHTTPLRLEDLEMALAGRDTVRMDPPSAQVPPVRGAPIGAAQTVQAMAEARKIYDTTTIRLAPPRATPARPRRRWWLLGAVVALAAAAGAWAVQRLRSPAPAPVVVTPVIAEPERVTVRQVIRAVPAPKVVAPSQPSRPAPPRAGRAGSSETAEDALRRGDRALRGDDPAAALRAYRRFLVLASKKDPRYFRVQARVEALSDVGSPN
jgi:eukaryotic-like serine/threonine-protein kinase